MEYFSEIYGSSYQAVAAVLAHAINFPVDTQEISRIVSRHTSEENTLYITSRLTSGEWPLLRRNDDGTFSSLIRHVPEMPLTKLQRAWLTAMLEDRRCAAFFDEEERSAIAAALDCRPLYRSGDVETVGVCLDGDSFSSPEYTARLRTVMEAIRERRILCITFTGGKGRCVKGDFLPCRLEYSSKDDKLRLYATRIRYGKIIFLATINLERIEEIQPSREHYDGEVDIDRMRLEARNSEPAVIELEDRRNALERFMLQFSSYEKRTRYIEEKDRYLCSIYYDSAYEKELLIQLISFGPVIKLLSPAGLVEQMRQRVEKQWKLLTAVEITGGQEN